MYRLSEKFYKKLINITLSVSIFSAVGLAGCGGGGGSGPASTTTTTTTVSPAGASCTTSITSGFTGNLNVTYSPALTGGGGAGGGDGGGSGGGSGGSGGAGAGGGEGKVLSGVMTITRLADGKVLGSAITDASSGLVTISPCGSDLPVLLTLSGQAGAQYYDEGTGKLTPFPAGTSLHTLVDQFDENVGVSFLTEGAYQYALNHMASGSGSLVGLTTAQVQSANQTVLMAINANLPTTIQLTSLKSLPTPIDSSSGTSALPNNSYGIAEAVVGGMVVAAAQAQPTSTAPALGLGAQLDADLTDGVINNLTISGTPAATASNVYYTPATLPSSTLVGIGSIAKQYGTSTILPLLPPTVSLSLSSSSINVGQSSTLIWSTNNATACTATGAWSGTEALNGTSMLTPTVAGTSTYGLSCTGPGGSAIGQATLTVAGSVSTPSPAPTVSISTNPTSITQGQSSTLTWSTSNATSCNATGDWSGSQTVNGTSTLAPSASGSYLYGLTCTGPGGSASGQAALTVIAPTVAPTPPTPIVSISVSPASITLGQSFTLNWSSSNANSCTGTGAWSGTQAVSGSSSMTPSAAGSYSYGLTCTGSGGTASNQATLTVTNATASTATVNLTVSPTSINLGDSATINWSDVGDEWCDPVGGWSSWQGMEAQMGNSATVLPTSSGNFVYALSCSNSTGSTTAQVTLTVGSGTSPGAPSTTPPTISSFAATPPSIVLGQTATLSWQGVGDEWCEPNGGWGSWTGIQALSYPGRSATVMPASVGTFTYQLICSFPSGSVSAQTTLTVTQ